MLDAVAGPDRRDRTSIDGPVPDFAAATQRSVRGLRVAFSPDFGHIDVAPDVADACARAVLRFEELGCSVTEVPVTWGSLAREIVEPIWTVRFAELFAERIEEHPDWMEASLRELVHAGRGCDVLRHQRALSRQTELYEQVRRLFDDYDLLLSPTMPDTAWPADREPDLPLFDRVGFTCPFNLTGHPAASMPCGFDRHGRPVGLQIVAGWHRDDLVLAAAAGFEQAEGLPTVPADI